MVSKNNIDKPSKNKKSKVNSNTTEQGDSPYIIALNQMFDNANRKDTPKGFSPLSGSEPSYKPSKWNDNPNIRRTHNCYAYVLDRILSGRKSKPQPGYFAGYPPLDDKDYHCDIFYERLKKDNPSLYLTEFEKPCKKGFHKGFLALADKGYDKDYHFYRQSKSGYWTHKPGATEATELDASGKRIINPYLADRNYKVYKYTNPCFFFCVNRNLTKAHSRSQSSN